MTQASDRGDFLARHGATLIEQGYDIVPIRVGLKHPGFDGWQEIKADSAKLREWLAKDFKHAGVGIVTKNTPAIDVDVYDPHVSAQMLEWIRENIGEAPTRIGMAPKALLLYSTDAPFTKVTSARYRGPDKKIHRIEILGSGQQFVAYHIHPETGKPYEWPDAGQSPLDVGVLDLPTLTEDQAVAVCEHFEEVADALGWERLDKADKASPSTRRGDADFDALAEVLPPDETDEEVARIKSALQAMKAVSSDYDYDRWRDVLFALKWTRWECAEDLARDWSESSDKHDEREFNKVWRGAQKKDRAREVTLGTLIGFAKECDWDASRKPSAEEQAESLEVILDEIEWLDTMGIDAQQTEVPKLMQRIANAGLSPTKEERALLALKKILKVTIGSLRKELKQTKTVEASDKATHAGYAQTLLATMEEKAGVPVIGVEGMIYVYSKSDCIYKGKATSDWEVQVARSFDGLENCTRRSDYVAIANHTYAIAADGNDAFFEKAPIGLACEKRFYRLSNEGEIVREPLTEDHRQRILSPVRPVVGDMPLFEKFIEQTFEGDPDEGQRDLLQEVVGAIYLGLMARYEKVVLFKGKGRAGKGTLLKIIGAMVPRESTAAVSPFKWDSEYYLANLAGKRLNLVGELPDDIPIPASYFKTVTGRDQLTGRHPSGRPFTFRNEAAHVFSTNHYIYTKDHTEAFYSRWLLLEFRNSRLGVDGAIQTDLAEQIIESELPAIAAWALKGAKRLIDRGYFLTTRVQAKMMSDWRHRTSTSMEFLLDTDSCKLDEKSFVRRSEFYKAYAEWCKESNRRPIGKQKLYDELASEALANFNLRFGVDTSGNDVIRGVMLKGYESSMWHSLVDDEEL